MMEEVYGYVFALMAVRIGFFATVSTPESGTPGLDPTQRSHYLSPDQKLLSAERL